MSDPIKLMRVYTDEAAYFGDRKVFEIVTERARAPDWPG
jgi:PII-like signaling protein